MLLNVVGAMGLVVEAKAKVTYEQIETALHEQAILSGYLIDVTDLVDSTRINVQVGVPIERITADGVPDLPAVQLLRSLTDALEGLEKRLAA
jgi:hypothetical protein